MRGRIVQEDPARGGYYTVEHLPEFKPWIFRVSGYSAEGHLLMRTLHTNEGSRNYERRCWEGRGATERVL